MLTFFQGRQKVKSSGSDLCSILQHWGWGQPLEAGSSLWPAQDMGDSSRILFLLQDTNFLGQCATWLQKPSPTAENMLIQKHLTISQHMETQAVCSGNVPPMLHWAKLPPSHFPSSLPSPGPGWYPCHSDSESSVPYSLRGTVFPVSAQNCHFSSFPRCVCVCGVFLFSSNWEVVNPLVSLRPEMCPQEEKYSVLYLLSENLPKWLLLEAKNYKSGFLLWMTK